MFTYHGIQYVLHSNNSTECTSVAFANFAQPWGSPMKPSVITTHSPIDSLRSVSCIRSTHSSMLCTVVLIHSSLSWCSALYFSMPSSQHQHVSCTNASCRLPSWPRSTTQTQLFYKSENSLTVMLIRPSPMLTQVPSSWCHSMLATKLPSMHHMKYLDASHCMAWPPKRQLPVVYQRW